MYIPEGVEYLSNYAFDDCTDLEAVYVPSTVESSYSFYPFTGCYSLETIYGYKNTEADWLAENIGAEFVEVKCTGIEVLSKPTKTEYLVGESFDSTGLTLKRSYNDGLFSSLITSGFTCKGFDSTKACEQVVTINYEDTTLYVPVTVRNQSDFLESISWKSQPKKLNYRVGDQALDPSGGVLQVNYSNGVQKEIDLASYMVSGFNTATTGTKNLTVSLYGKSLSLNITVEQALKGEFQVHSKGTSTYNGNPQTPNIRVSYNGVVVSEGNDYTISCSNNTNAGKANYVITGINDYAGIMAEGTFTIAPFDISDADVYVATSAKYTGKRVSPSCEVIANENITLVEDTDYVLNCTENADQGYAYAEIIGIGNYCGYQKKSYSVTYTRPTGSTVTKNAATAGNFTLNMSGGSLKLTVPGEVLYGYTLFKNSGSSSTVESSYSARTPSSRNGGSMTIDFSYLSSGTYTLLYSYSSYTVTVRNVNGSYQYVYEPKTTLGSGRATITLTSPTPPSITNATSLIAEPGIPVDYNHMVLPVGSSPANANVFPLTWTSSDENVATVSDGYVTLLKAGEVTITAKYGAKKATWSMDIAPLDIAKVSEIGSCDPSGSGVELWHGSRKLQANTDYTFTYEIKDGVIYYTVKGTGLYGGTLQTAAYINKTDVTPYGCKHNFKTCSAAGDIYHTASCTNCGTTVSRPHVWNGGKATAAGCASDGNTLYTCTACAQTGTLIVPCTGNHKWSSWKVAANGTCQLVSLKSRSCSACKAVETVLGDLGSHSFGPWEVVTEAQIGEEGLKRRECIHCFKEETERIPAKSETKPSNPFVDVPEDQYYFEPVLWAVENGITAGIDATHFAPDNVCTRAQVVTFLWRAAGNPEPTSTRNPFSDVTSADYFYKPVLWAVENGITQGTSTTTFSPNNPCTRAQVVTFLWRNHGCQTINEANPFSDVTKTDYYYNAVLWAVKNEITSGVGNGLFAPDGSCLRSQIVTFLYRYYN